MPLSKFLDPKNDLAFKRIFGTERNKDILIHFLNDIFAGEVAPIEKVEFMKPIQEPEIASQRVSIVDIMCKAAIGDQFIIEMQVLHEPGFEKRAQFYAARAYIDQRQAGTKYHDLKQVIFLAITDFTLFPNKPSYLSHHHVLDKKTLERDLKDFSFSFLELPKFNHTIAELHTMTEKWAYFFKHGTETSENEMLQIAGQDIIITRAYEELNRYSWTPEELRTYNSIDMKREADAAILQGALSRGKEEGLVEGLTKGLAEGLTKGLAEGLTKGLVEGVKKGAEEKQLAIAQKLLKSGEYSIEEIAEITDLSLKQIKEQI